MKIRLLFLFCLFPIYAFPNIWYPVPVYVWDKDGVNADERYQIDYIPLRKAKKKWKICVSFPHVKNSFWMAVDFGMVKESQRLGIALEVFEASGYSNLDIQKYHLRNCAAQDPDGVIVGAISAEGLNDVIRDFAAHDIPVIDLVNGINSPYISAVSSYSHYDMGYMIGQYISAQEKAHDPCRKTRIAWLPGPKGSGWVDNSSKGFFDAISQDEQLEIVEVLYGDTDKFAQTTLLKELLSTTPNIDFIAGTAETAEVALPLLRRMKLTDKTQVITQYFNPSVYAGIRNGKIKAGVSLSAVIQGRIAIDQMVRILENKPFHKHVNMKLKIVEKQSMREFDRSTTLAPNGFKAVYSVN